MTDKLLFEVTYPNGEEATYPLPKEPNQNEIDYVAHSILNTLTEQDALEDDDESKTKYTCEYEDTEVKEIVERRVEFLKEQRIGFVRDQNYYNDKLVKFFGHYALITGDSPEETEELHRKFKENNKLTGEALEDDLHGTARKFSKEEFLTWLNRMEFECCLLKLRSLGVDFSASIKDATEEEINNILGHRGIVTALDSNGINYTSRVIFNGGFMVHYGRNRAVTALRAYISRITGEFYTTRIVTATAVSHWMKSTGTDVNPLDLTQEQLDKIAQAAGTSIQEIEDHYQEQLEKLSAEDNAVVVVDNPKV